MERLIVALLRDKLVQMAVGARVAEQNEALDFLNGFIESLPVFAKDGGAFDH
jgi:hypothetical protein